MVRQVLDRALACDNGLDEESKHGEHSLHAARIVRTLISYGIAQHFNLKPSRLKMPLSHQIETMQAAMLKSHGNMGGP